MIISVTVTVNLNHTVWTYSTQISVYNSIRHTLVELKTLMCMASVLIQSMAPSAPNEYRVRQKISIVCFSLHVLRRLAFFLYMRLNL